MDRLDAHAAVIAEQLHAVLAVHNGGGLAAAFQAASLELVARDGRDPPAGGGRAGEGDLVDTWLYALTSTSVQVTDLGM
jgi:hypothetical protein